MLCDKNTAGSLALSQPRLCLHSPGTGIWKCLARLCTHWELSDNSHFKLFWYQLCRELLFPWEHDLPLGSGACYTARRINSKSESKRGGRGKNREADGKRESAHCGYISIKKKIKKYNLMNGDNSVNTTCRYWWLVKKKNRISIIEVFCWVVGSYVEVKGDGVRGETFSLC